MQKDDSLLMSRRRLLFAALLGGGAATLPACAPPSGADDEGLWTGFDERITERTLAEAEKLFDVKFTEEERRLILGGPVEEKEDGTFATQTEMGPQLDTTYAHNFAVPQPLCDWYDP